MCGRLLYARRTRPCGEGPAEGTYSSPLCAVQPCELYRNDKPAEQQVFAAAAALFALTGDAKYRATADRLIAAAGSSAFTFFNSWNNVWAQGVTILASTERQDPAGATRSKGRYREDLKQAVAYWTDCYERGSNGGFCKCAAAEACEDSVGCAG